MCCLFNDTATTEIYTLSLHDALPISPDKPGFLGRHVDLLGRSLEPAGETTPDAVLSGYLFRGATETARTLSEKDRKSTRLNSSHANISYAVFCLKKNSIHVHLQANS